MYWMSSNSSIKASNALSRLMRLLPASQEERRIDSVDAAPLLHLVKHRGQTCLHLEGLLYFVGSDERILTIFEKARALMFADEFNESRSVGLPIHRETFQILERGADPETGEQGNGIFGIFVKVSVENPLIHEIRFATDVEED